MGTSVLTAIATPVISDEIIKTAFSFFSRTSMREKGREKRSKKEVIRMCLRKTE